MNAGPPKVIAINHDDSHARHIGRTEDGWQFILTTPFEPAIRDRPGCEFVALYLFDAAGQLLETRIRSFGPRDRHDLAASNAFFDDCLKTLGKFSFERIEVAPFAVDRFGTRFGLVLRDREDEEDVWAVEMMPGNYMAFFEPWDSGEYDT